MDDQLTIREISQRTGLSEHNLRYYERIGLITPVQRNPSSRHRRYAALDIGWVNFLNCMRSTGMPIAQMRRYADLLKRGGDTAAERRRMLEDHKRTVEDRIRELQEIVAFLDKKIDYHRALEANGGVDSEETRHMLQEIDNAHNRRK